MIRVTPAQVSGHPAIAAHMDKFWGIRNGIDQDIWDPLEDRFLPRCVGLAWDGPCFVLMGLLCKPWRHLPRHTWEHAAQQRGSIAWE